MKFVSDPIMNSTDTWTTSTRPLSGDQQPTTVTVSMSADETQIVTIQSTSFITRTVTETVRAAPGVVITTKTSHFPNVSDAGFSQPWMTATGTDLSRWLSGDSFPGEMGHGPDPYSPSTVKHTESIVQDTSDIYSEFSSVTSRFSSPASVSASTTSIEDATSVLPLPDTTSAFSSSEYPTPIPSHQPVPSIAETDVAPLSGGPAFSTSIAQSDSIEPSSTSSTQTSSSPAFFQPSETFATISTSPTKEVPVIVPFTRTGYSFSADCPLTEDCATWEPEVPNPTHNVVSPIDAQGDDPDGFFQAEGPFPIHKRNISVGAPLDSRGYGLLVAFFIAGIVCGIGLFLVGRGLWSVWSRRRHRKRRIPSGRDTELDILPRRRRGMDSPTHVSGMQSRSRENLADTRLLRRSWQEDGVV